MFSSNYKLLQNSLVSLNISLPPLSPPLDKTTSTYCFDALMWTTPWTPITLSTCFCKVTCHALSNDLYKSSSSSTPNYRVLVFKSISKAPMVFCSLKTFEASTAFERTLSCKLLSFHCYLHFLLLSILHAT